MNRTYRWLILALSGFLLLALRAPAGPRALEASGPSTGQVTIVRDEYGVPHVFASTPESLWYGAGYAQAQDRLWQAEVLRRTAKGTSAEFFGPSAVDGDVVSRTLFGPDEQRTAMLASAPAEVRLLFEAFSDGMNAWIAEATAGGQLPIEYALFGVSPEPWAPEDSLAIAQLLFTQFGEFGDGELTNAAHLQELIARFGPAEGTAVFLDTHWLNDPDARTTIPAMGAINPARRGSAPRPHLPSGVGHGQSQWEEAKEGWQRNLDRAGLRRGPASNAMVFGPSMTADGRALLLGGPQMGYSAPQINHEMGIHRGNLHVTGMEIAGVPWIPIGVTESFAWTLTSGISDNVDIYFEVLNPANPGQYLYQGAYVEFDCRLEVFNVRGAADVNQNVCESVHGPVLGSAPGLAFTRKSPVRGREIQTIEAFIEIYEARTPVEVSASLSRVAPNLNFHYADTRGNIGYWHFGKIPVRASGDNPWFPHDGTGAAEWQGFVPWEEMPHTLNPDQGWITNWNNKPAADWDNTVFGFGNWGPTQRVNTLFNLIEGLTPGTVTPETVAELNRLAGLTTDTPSGNASAVFVSTLLDDMLARVDETADGRLPDAVALLASWDWLQTDEDGDGLYDSPGVALFNTWWQTFVDRVFADDLGGVSDRVLNGNLTYRLLDADPALPLQHDYLGGETAEEALTYALIDTLDVLTAQYGTADMAGWLQPAAEIVWSPIGAGSVPNTLWMNRGTYNQIVHLGPGPELYGMNVIAPGQSGDPFSPHFADQLSLYATWAYKPMRLNRTDLRGNIESITRLNP